MPLQGTYGVLRGRVAGGRHDTRSQDPHYAIHVVADGEHYRVAVNVQSRVAPSTLLYLVDAQFDHPLIASLGQTAEGFTPLHGGVDTGGLDYIRGNLFHRNDMRLLPANVSGPDNDLQDLLDHHVERAARSAGGGVRLRRRLGARSQERQDLPLQARPWGA
jgi:uncharacterized protein YukJ